MPQKKLTLHEDIEASLRTYELLIGVFASRTRDMIGRYGEIEALSRLVTSADLQQGFKILRDMRKLDATFEAVITRHTSDFRAQIVEAAAWRIENADRLE
ncbi:hypothetical protein GALL_161580 [mine drainage metagenome]|uniref:Uncharacterized protein n=1 Tax=mine drainage metagenome TaxID=410659 RepID=A0A1J5SCS6_9ZZZZ